MTKQQQRYDVNICTDDGEHYISWTYPTRPEAYQACIEIARRAHANGDKITPYVVPEGENPLDPPAGTPTTEHSA